MRLPIAAFSLVLACATGAGALADQKDSRLVGLFERLQTTGSTSEARDLESRIWTIWFAYDGADPLVLRLMGQAEVAMRLRNQDRAEQLLTRVTELAPDFAEGWNRRATSRYLAGDYDGSVADIQRTLELEPRHFGALSGLGLIYTELEEPERAMAAFEAALEINPHLPGARANIERLRGMLDGDPI